ncbi:mitochondrial coenzyme A diphosphatase NUDT8 [Diabrotica virgifera virgifera]|uniref:Nucleoside diphosphate-linked moiety X motif 8 n=1 Tax=Diabrotica virgifera virgifera TaxID=50390 RepID=A0A6P7H1M9_DIAVI|nr:mitochondrial coenzyme A diphosphatase NUDT8 [Diabrotica virgifera virgifera]
MFRVGQRFFCSNQLSNYFSSDYLYTEENVKRTASKFASMKCIRFNKKEPEARAAVLIPLCEVDGKVALLYTLRAAHLKNHRGQVSFPGGKQDEGDKSLEATALRETHEELGIHPDDVEVWGSGNLIVTRGETCVLPVIGRVVKPLSDSLKVNPTEVEEVFTVTLEDLCKPEYLGHTQFRRRSSLPVFLAGKRRVWGLTALITNMFLTALLPNKAYSHRIKYISTVKLIEPKST